MKLRVWMEIDVPDDATHYSGDLHVQGEHNWWKCQKVGIGGEHWFVWRSGDTEWRFSQHAKPWWIKEIPRGLEDDIVLHPVPLDKVGEGEWLACQRGKFIVCEVGEKLDTQACAEIGREFLMRLNDVPGYLSLRKQR